MAVTCAGGRLLAFRALLPEPWARLAPGRVGGECPRGVSALGPGAQVAPGARRGQLPGAGARHQSCGPSRLPNPRAEGAWSAATALPHRPLGLPSPTVMGANA